MLCLKRKVQEEFNVFRTTQMVIGSSAIILSAAYAFATMNMSLAVGIGLLFGLFAIITAMRKKFD